MSDYSYSTQMYSIAAHPEIQYMQQYAEVPVQNAIAYNNAMMQFQLKQQDKNYDYWLKARLEEFKMELKKEYLLTHEEMRLIKEFPDFEIVKGSNQSLYIEYKDKKGNCKFTKKICDAVALTVFVITSYYRGKNYLAYRVSWRGEGNSFYLREEQMTPERLAKELAKHFCPIRVNNKYKEMVQTLVLIFLIEESVELKDIPYTTGWIKSRDGSWKVTGSDKNTMKEILKQCSK